MAPLAAIWSGLPEGTNLPPGAVKVFRQEQPRPIYQNFWEVRQGSQCPFQHGLGGDPP